MEKEEVAVEVNIEEEANSGLVVDLIVDIVK